MSTGASSLATTAERHLGRSSESRMVQMFQHATLRLAVFFLSVVFLTAWKRYPLTAANQPGKGETSFV